MASKKIILEDFEEEENSSSEVVEKHIEHEFEVDKAKSPCVLINLL